MPENNSRVLWLNADEIVMAMKDQSVEWWIDSISGRLCMDPEAAELMFGEEGAESWTPDNPDHLLPLPEVTGSDAFRLMERFIDTEAGHEASAALAAALKERKPFRRFKDVLAEFAADRDRWFQFEAAAMKRTAEGFYAFEGFEIRWIGSPSEATGRR